MKKNKQKPGIAKNIVQKAENAASFKNLWVYFIVIVMALLVITVVVASSLSKLVNWLLDTDIEISIYVWTMLFSVLIGVAMSIIIGKIFFSPILKLSAAMRKVAGGDFNVRLEVSSSVNEIRAMVENFNIMTKELAATEMLQSDFVSNVSHEFKTPISVIAGYTTLLQDEKLSEEERRDYLQKISMNTDRLSNLVENVLLLSKVDNQNISAKNQIYRLDEQVRQCIVMLSSKWENKEIEIDAHLDEIEYFGNERLMQHVWVNLIDNAIKFNKIGGKIFIDARKEGNTIVVSVADEGYGIPEDGISHIYDKFYQVDGSHKGEGNGLGLSLVKRILDISDGKIECGNRAEGGAVFTVYLPSGIEENA